MMYSCDSINKMFVFPGDNIQTAVSVARECGILATNEQIVDIVVVSKGDKERPEISFNVQSRSPSLVNSLNFLLHNIRVTLSRVILAFFLQSTQNQIFAMPSIEEVECGTADRNYRFVLTGQTWQTLRE